MAETPVGDVIGLASSECATHSAERVAEVDLHDLRRRLIGHEISSWRIASAETWDELCRVATDNPSRAYRVLTEPIVDRRQRH